VDLVDVDRVEVGLVDVDRVEVGLVDVDRVEVDLVDVDGVEVDLVDVDLGAAEADLVELDLVEPALGAADLPDAALVDRLDPPETADLADPDYAEVLGGGEAAEALAEAALAETALETVLETGLDAASDAVPDPAAPDAVPVADADPLATEYDGYLATGSPIPGYDEMTFPQLRGRLRSLSAEQLEELVAYERRTAARPQFLTMLENRLATVRSR
jgi:hypothetical protein